MRKNYNNWRKLFLFCLGLFAGTAFCMKWMEKDLVMNGSLFTVIGLEVSYPKEQVMALLSGIDDHVRTILGYHLHFDFAFMAGVYPGIAALCMMARYKVTAGWLKNLLLALALLQAVALVCDVTENSFILQWIKAPASAGHFATYHLVVYTKWILALLAAVIAIPLQFRKGKWESTAV
ncbi:MAG: hypothetical protein U0U70_10610 [Chitinophagaceae bacterium]